MSIDTSFDFRNDAFGKDPDAFSPTLRRYHRVLWSKALPSGVVFSLDDSTPGAYLHHLSDVGEFFLSSDSVMQTFTRWIALKPITEQFPEVENEAFRTISYTVGAMMIWPGYRVDGMMTINGARGLSRKIADRMDLTLECIRRYYLGEPSPLAVVLQRYRDYFALFSTFRGFVDFFLLHDLIDADSTVKFFMPFDNFKTPSVPLDTETFREYRRLSIEFIEARNLRIRGLAISLLD